MTAPQAAIAPSGGNDDEVSGAAGPLSSTSSDDDADVELSQQSRRAATKPPRSNQKTTTKKTATATTSPTMVSSQKSLSCPHCRKKFSSPLGRQYHVEHNVCRRKQNQPSTPSSSAAAAALTPQQSQASDPTNVCPHCNKTFTTAQGKEYHVRNLVCRPEARQQQPPLASPPRGSVAEAIAERAMAPTTGRKTPGNTLRTSSGRTVRLRVAPVQDDSSSCNSDTDSEPDDNNSDTTDREDGGAGSSSDQPVGGRSTGHGRGRPPGSKHPASAMNTKKRSSVAVPDETGSAYPRKNQRRSDQGSDPAPASDVCPYCSKAFATPYGAQYHIDHYVCRQQERPGGPVAKGRRRVEASAAAATSVASSAPTTTTPARHYPKVRGALSDRTCRKCRRVFTSVLGLQYHTDKRVCEMDAERALAKERPYFRLSAGQTFAVPQCGGAVVVVRDDRGPDPVGQLPEGLDKLLKSWRKVQGRCEDRRVASYVVAAGQSLFRRAQLSQLYQEGRVTAWNVQRVYRSGGSSSTPGRLAVSQALSDPSAPDGSYPDRIVECRVIPDEREHFVVNADCSHDVVRRCDGVVGEDGGYRVFLRRRDLQHNYDKSASTFSCSQCGQSFMSRPGAVHHVRSGACASRKKSHASATARNLQSVQDRVDYFEKQARASPNENLATAKRTFPKKKAKKIENVPVYPQVWLSLGFKLLPRSEATTKEGMVSAFVDETPVDELEPPVVSSAVVPAVNVKVRKTVIDPKLHPRIVLRELEEEWRALKSHSVGPMYPEVFHALGYLDFDPRENAKRRKRRRAEQERKHQQELLRKRQRAEKKRRLAELPRATVSRVDTRVLANEIEAGRYPSIKLYDGEHDEICALCKEGSDDELLVDCDFCKQAIHYSCLLLRWVVQEPEPGLRFMCQTCIGVICSRRERAEKRRLEKVGETDRNATAKAPSKFALLKGVVRGQEFECLEAQGQRVSDLTVLLKDARNRLSAALEASSLNRLRRSMMEPMRETPATKESTEEWM